MVTQPETSQPFIEVNISRNFPSGAGLLQFLVHFWLQPLQCSCFQGTKNEEMLSSTALHKIYKL